MPARAPELEESIYNLIPAPASTAAKAALYHSKHPYSTPPTASTFGASIATATLVTNSGGEYSNPAKVHAHIKPFAEFGPKQLHTSDPAAFTSAHTHPALPAPGAHAYTDRRKPPVDTAALPLKSRPTRNFIGENTSKAVSSSPPPPPAASPPRYALKPDYGQVPAYLAEVKTAVAEEKELIASLTSPAPVSRAELLKEDERVALLHGLKVRWEALMKDYQVLTHMSSHTLSMGNLKRKEELERRLNDTEKAIKKIDKHFVLIAQ